MQSAADFQKQLRLLNRVGRSLRHTSDFPQVCKTIVSAIIAETSAENCSLYVMDNKQQSLILRVAMGKGDLVPVFFHADNAEEQLQFRLGEGIMGRAALERRPFFIDDVAQSSEFLLHDASSVAVKSLLCVPVIDGDELLGGINLSHSESGTLGESLLASLEIIADQTAKALKNALLITQLQQNNQHLEQEVVKGYRKLADSERKYRFLVEQAAEGIVATKDGSILYANPRFWLMAGCDDAPGTALSDILDLANRQQLMTPCQYREFSGQESDCYKPEFHFETELKHVQGSPVKVEVTGCQVPDDHGFIQQFYVRDISDRVHLDKMKDTFFASLVHELKTPITVINSYLQQLIGDMKKSGEKRQNIFVDLDKASKRLIKLLNDILAYSRLNYAGQQLTMRCWPINDEILNTIDYFHPLLEKKGITVDCDLQTDLPSFLFDREKIGQVLVNLMDNAIKFTNSGGKITWRCQEVVFYDSMDTDDAAAEINQAQDGTGSKERKGVCVSIEDTGSGIPEKDAQQVFSEFYSGHHGEGSGLGLSICRKIIQYHQGCISAERTTQGSKFVFILPLCFGTS